MSGNARGQLKEQLEGIARNLIWVTVHCEKGLAIIGDTHPELQEFFKVIRTEADTLNDLSAAVYAKL